MRTASSARAKDAQRFEDIFTLPSGEKAVSAVWLDDGSPLDLEEREGRTVVKTAPYFYGRNYVVRVAKICVDVQ